MNKCMFIIIITTLHFLLMNCVFENQFNYKNPLNFKMIHLGNLTIYENWNFNFTHSYRITWIIQQSLGWYLICIESVLVRTHSPNDDRIQTCASGKGKIKIMSKCGDLMLIRLAHLVKYIIFDICLRFNIMHACCNLQCQYCNTLYQSWWSLYYIKCIKVQLHYWLVHNW